MNTTVQDRESLVKDWNNYRSGNDDNNSKMSLDEFAEFAYEIYGLTEEEAAAIFEDSDGLEGCCCNDDGYLDFTEFTKATADCFTKATADSIDMSILDTEELGPPEYVGTADSIDVSNLDINELGPPVQVALNGDAIGGLDQEGQNQAAAFHGGPIGQPPTVHAGGYVATDDSSGLMPSVPPGQQPATPATGATQTYTGVPPGQQPATPATGATQTYTGVPPGQQPATPATGATQTYTGVPPGQQPATPATGATQTYTGLVFNTTEEYAAANAAANGTAAETAADGTAAAETAAAETTIPQGYISASDPQFKDLLKVAGLTAVDPELYELLSGDLNGATHATIVTNYLEPEGFMEVDAEGVGRITDDGRDFLAYLKDDSNLPDDYTFPDGTDLTADSVVPEGTFFTSEQIEDHIEPYKEYLTDKAIKNLGHGAISADENVMRFMTEDENGKMGSKAFENMLDRGYLEINDQGAVTATPKGEALLAFIDMQGEEYFGTKENDDHMNAFEEHSKDFVHINGTYGASPEAMELIQGEDGHVIVSKEIKLMIDSGILNTENGLIVLGENGQEMLEWLDDNPEIVSSVKGQDPSTQDKLDAFEARYDYASGLKKDFEKLTSTDEGVKLFIEEGRMNADLASKLMNQGYLKLEDDGKLQLTSKGQELLDYIESPRTGELGSDDNHTLNQMRKAYEKSSLT